MAVGIHTQAVPEPRGAAKILFRNAYNEIDQLMVHHALLPKHL
jgi:hypothetical protein